MRYENTRGALGMNALTSTLERLTPREEMVLRLRFGIGEKPLTRREVGDRFKISQWKVSEIERRAIRRVFDILDTA